MRIAVNGCFYARPNTGSGQYLRELVPALAQADPDNEYVVVIPETDVTGSEITEWTGVSPRVLIYPEALGPGRLSENFGKVWFEQVAFNRACVREHVALAHIPYWGSPLQPQCPTVVTVHDLIPLILEPYRGSLPVQLYTSLVSASARRADVVIADSECTKRDLMSHLRIAEERIHVVYLAAHPRFRPIADPVALEAMRARYALPKHYLLYLGGYDARKNVQLIIEAMARLPELYSAGYRLAFAGVSLGTDSDLFPSPQRMAREAILPEDAIHYLGWVPEEDKPLLYAGADLFLFPSIYEGFGLPALEAMACGTPVLASNTSSLPEIVGSAGILLDPNNPAAWAGSMRAVLEGADRRSELCARGLVQAAKFSWERAAEETLAAYRSVPARAQGEHNSKAT